MSQRRIVLRRDVPDDLHSIVTWLDQFSTSASDRFTKAVFAAMKDVAEMSGKGSPKHFRNRRLEGIRSWGVPGFRKILILYRRIPDGIDVLVVVHGSRNLRSMLLQRI